MFGYAINETPEFMPLSISMSHKLVHDLPSCVKERNVKFLRPDAKSQVTVEYQDGKASRIDTVVISTQHSPDVDQKEIKEFVMEELVRRSHSVELDGCQNEISHQSHRPLRGRRTGRAIAV